MTDIVEELRKLAEDLIALDLDMRLPPRSLNPHLAADEIERLRKENEELKAALREDAERMKADQNAIDSLRLSLSETEDNTLLGYLADIRQKSGVGIKPMLSELADAIASALSEARATGRREDTNGDHHE